MTADLLLALVVLSVLIAAVLRTVAAPSLTWIGVTVAAAVLWLPANKPVEGPLLLALGDGHGVTASDLVSVVAVVLVVLALRRSRRDQSVDVD